MHSLFIYPVTNEDVMQVISSLKNKTSAGLDEIPDTMLKRCSNLVSNVLTFICNSSFKCGIIPVKLKIALVKPLHKLCSTEVMTNYRPVSLLSIFSKVFKKLI